MSHNNETLSVNTETGEFHRKFIKAKEEFTKFCVIFFCNFVINKIMIEYIDDDYEEISNILITFFNNNKYI